MPNFRPGLVSISFRQHSPERILQAITGLQLQGIEWGGDVHVPHGDLDTARRVGRMTRDAGLEPFCYGSYYRFRESHPTNRERGPEIEAVLDSAVALGAKRVRLWAGEMDFEQAEKAYVAAVADRAYEIGELAQQRGLAIDLEFHGGTLNNSAEHSLALLGLIGHPNVHTLWQPAVPLSVAERVKGMERLLPHISNIHCFHWGPGGWNERYWLLDGEQAWKTYLATARQTNTDRWVSLEYVKDDSFDSLARDAGTLAEWLQCL